MVGYLCAPYAYALADLVRYYLSYYGIFTWLPSLLVKEGYSIVQSFEYVLIMILAQFPGYLVAAWLVEKLGRKPTWPVLLACARSRPISLVSRVVLLKL